jgi:hypothetical protein
VEAAGFGAALAFQLQQFALTLGENGLRRCELCGHRTAEIDREAGWWP